MCKVGVDYKLNNYTNYIPPHLPTGLYNCSFMFVNLISIFIKCVKYNFDEHKMIKYIYTYMRYAF